MLSFCLSRKIQFKNFSNFLFCQVVRSFLTILKSLSACLLLEGNINTAGLPLPPPALRNCTDRLPALNNMELNTIELNTMELCWHWELARWSYMCVMVLPSLCCILKMFPALNWYHLSRGYLVTTIFINKTHIFFCPLAAQRLIEKCGDVETILSLQWEVESVEKL